ncbi:hypothetical protein EGW08_010927, partial [Elysia chlorotica]
LLLHLVHTLVCRCAPIIKEEGSLPVVIVSFQDVPLGCVGHGPGVEGSLSGAGDHRRLHRAEDGKRTELDEVGWCQHRSLLQFSLGLCEASSVLHHVTGEEAHPPLVMITEQPLDDA